MLELHTDREGSMKPIAAMDDAHLRNTIKMWFRPLRAAFSFQVNEDLDEFQRSLYQIPEFDNADAGVVARSALQRLYPYLSEAFLRGFEDIREELAEILGRDSQLDGVLGSTNPTLPRLDDGDSSWHPGNPESWWD